jgi:hypothetical protein
LEQKYHSIQARGEKVEEMLRAHGKQSNGVLVHLCKLGQKSSHSFSSEDMDYEDGQVEEKNDHDHQAKKSLQEETADHDTNYLGNGSQVS